MRVDLRPETLAELPLWLPPPLEPDPLEPPPRSNARKGRTDRLLRTGLLLTASSLATSGLGAGYWVFVARWYSPSEVGRAYSAVSAMMFLAGFGQLNLSNVLVRFVPTAAAGTARLIRRVYLVAVGVTALISALFVFFVPHLSPALDFLHTPWAGLGFTVGAVAYGLFVIQDGALTGLLRADWVLLENAVFSVAKVGFVVLFAVIVLPQGILVSWYAALAVAIGLTNWLLFARAVPKHTRETTALPSPDRPTVAYLAGDFTGAMCWLVATTLMPLIVTDRLGAEQSAYFSLPWMVAYTLYLFSANMGSSIVVEAATDLAYLAANCRKVLWHTGPRLLAAVAASVLAAPLILRVFGAGYAVHATGLIRLLLLSALPNLIVDTAVASGRAQRRIGVVVAILAADSGAAIALAFLLLPRFGIAGAGYGWVIAQSATALVLLVRRSWWLGASKAHSGPGRHGAVPPGNGRWFSRGADLGLDAVRRVRSVWAWPSDRAAARRAARTEAVPGAQRVAGPALRSLRPPADVLVVRLRDEPAAVHWARTLPARRRLSHQAEALQVLYDDARLGAWRELLPRIVASEPAMPPRWTAERRLPGVSGSRLLREQAEAAPRLTVAALTAINHLHKVTGREQIVGAAQLERWVDAPLDALGRHLARQRCRPDPATTAALRAFLYSRLDGRPLTVGWVHRDFHPGNVLFSPDGTRVTGILDWADAIPDGPTALDATRFTLATRLGPSGRGIGELTVRALRAPDREETDPGLLLLTWLWHITDTLDESVRYLSSRIWIRRDVLDVLEAVAR